MRLLARSRRRLSRWGPSVGFSCQTHGGSRSDEYHTARVWLSWATKWRQVSRLATSTAATDLIRSFSRFRSPFCRVTTLKLKTELKLPKSYLTIEWYPKLILKHAPNNDLLGQLFDETVFWFDAPKHGFPGLSSSHSVVCRCQYYDVQHLDLVIRSPYRQLIARARQH